MDLADSLETKKTSTAIDQSKEEITFESLRGRLADKARAGHKEAIRQLLAKHGAERLSDVDKNEYAALLSEAEALT